MPDGPAKFGYFVSKDQTRKNADNVCVLVVHYNFENTKDESWIRKGDDQDVKNLERTFRVNRNCDFSSILSPGKEELLQLLADQEELLQLFGCTDVPSVFVLYILSHGYRDGKIFTDHYQNEDPNDFISFTTTDIFESLKKLTGFDDCLKFINFGPCRGELGDVIFFEKDAKFKNENSCRITYSPQMRNMVVFFSTVETTRAKRNQSGTTFVSLTCQVFNSLEKDESIINVLAIIQYESHKIWDIMENNYTGQTPEVKMFSQDRIFVISKSTTNYSTSSTSDAKSSKIKTKREFYSWMSSSGENLRHRLAILFSTEPNEQLKEIKRALSQNLEFETSVRLLSGKPWISINKAPRLDSDIGCIFLFLFGRISENKDTHEVCVQVDGQEIAASEILREFIGPKNDQWIGKPKILFLVDQETSSFDYIGSIHPKMTISATNHSGWLVLVLHNKEELEKLIDIFKGQDLKKDKSLQELLVASLMISETIGNRDMLNSTLQYLLNFPDWPRSFVKLNFLLKKTKISREKHVSFDSLVKESARKKQIWLLSSVAGTGKTTILREMAFQLGKLNQELKILRISIPRVSFRSLKRNVTEIEFLAEATQNSKEEIKKSIENKQCVVFFDEFDEIRPENQEKTLKIMEALEKKQISVWVGTRPHAAEAVQKRISNAILVEIDPLDEEQQIELFQLETGKSREECEQFIQNFTSKDILENPLHLSLVAKYGAEGNLYQIYDQVVRQKVEDTLIKEGFDKNNFSKFQENIAIAMEDLQRFANYHIRGDKRIGDTRDNLVKNNYYGIATFENNKVIFIHQTFAEFLAALFFLREVEDSGESDFETSIEDISHVFFRQSFSWCRKFVDLFYCTLINDEEKIEEHRESLLSVLKLNPDRFLRLIASDGCKKTLELIDPIITFSKNQEGDCISVARDTSLLVEAIDGAEEIAIMLLDTDLINSDDELKIILPYLLKSVAETNATLFFEKLKTKYPRLPEMIYSRRFLIDAGVIAASKNHDEILILLLQSGVDIDFMDFMNGNALHCAVRCGAMNCVNILLQHGAKLAKCGSSVNSNPLIEAVVDDNVDLVKFLLEENITGLPRYKEMYEINDERAYLNWSPLQLSAINGNLELCRWLVDEVGVDVNTLQPSGEPRDWSQNDQICMDHFLILQKSDITMTDERGKTALHCAAEYGYLERVQELIHSGANIRDVDENGWNAFHFACKSNSDNKEQVIQLLHSTDSQLAKERTKNGETGLHILLKSKYCSVEVACFLVEEIGVDVWAEDKNGCTALQFAYHEECVNYLMTKAINIEGKNNEGQTCLHFAAGKGDLEALQAWIDLGGDVDVVDNEGLTALHYAAKKGHLLFVKKLLACAAEADAKKQDVGESSVGLSIIKNERVNRRDNKGRTALHLAAESKNVDLMKWLLENNAELTLTDMEGNNAMCYAFDSEEMLRFINEKNKHLVEQCSHYGYTTLHLALNFKNAVDDNIIRWIVEQLDDIALNAKNDFGDTPLLLACQRRLWSVAELLLTRNVDVNVSDRLGKTAMHYVAYSENLCLVKLMHEKGADLTLTDCKGMNALHHAVHYYEAFIYLHEENNALIKQRLNNGDTTLHCGIRSSVTHKKFIILLVDICQADLNSTNEKGETPLLLACKRKKWNFTEILLEKSPDINVKDLKERTALHYAVNLDGADCLEYTYALDLVLELWKRGADLTLTDNDGKNAFHHSIMNFNMALFIHDINGDLVKQRLNNGDTTLHLAVKLEEILDENFLIWLIEQSENDLNVKNGERKTPLMLSLQKKRLNVSKILLAKSVDLNVKDNNGRTALHYAVQLDEDDELEDSDAFDLVPEFCKRGADLALTDNDGMNAFHRAIGSFQMALFIHNLNGDLVKQHLNNGDTTLHLAIKLQEYRDDDIIPWLVEQCENDLNVRNNEGETPLIVACIKGEWIFATTLLNASVDIHVRDNNGRTAVHYAVRFDDFYEQEDELEYENDDELKDELEDELEDEQEDEQEDENDDELQDINQFDLVQEFCKRGADLALTDNDGKNALHHAIANYHIVLFIHKLNDDLVKQRLNNGDTTLHLAIKLYKHNRNDKFLIWLVEQGLVDLNATNALNETPLILACKERLWHKKFFKIILSKNVDLSIIDNEGKSARDYIDESCPTHLLRRFDEMEASPSKKMRLN